MINSLVSADCLGVDPTPVVKVRAEAISDVDRNREQRAKVNMTSKQLSMGNSGK